MGMVTDRDGDIWREIKPGIWQLQEYWPRDMRPVLTTEELEKHWGPVTTTRSGNRSS